MPRSRAPVFACRPVSTAPITALVATLQAQARAVELRSEWYLQRYCAPSRGHADDWTCRDWRGCT